MNLVYTERKAENDGSVIVNAYTSSCATTLVFIKFIHIFVRWDCDKEYEKFIHFDGFEKDSFVIREAIRIFDRLVKEHPNL